MRYYYFILDDSFWNTGAGFLITFKEKFSKNDNGKGPWQCNEYETLWYKPLPLSDGRWIDRVVAGMAARRVFDSHDPEDRHRLVKAILNADDGGFNV